MIKVLVTGQIGAGKSTFAKLLSTGNAELLIADEIVRGLYATKPRILDEIEVRLDEIFRDSNGNLDRSKLAARIFQDAAAKHQVEAIVHPAVEEMVATAIANSTAELFVYENAVIKAGSNLSTFDEIFRVVAPAEVRLQRLIQRGLTETDAQMRISNQEQDLDLFTGGTEITNAGDLADLKIKVQEIRARLGLQND